MSAKNALLCAIMLFPAALVAHPAPEIPVRTHLDTDKGTLEIRVEVDPRVYFEGDPEEEPFLMKWVLDRSSEEEKAEMIAGASPYVAKSVQFLLEPEGELHPEFEWKFGKLGDDGTPLEKIDDKAVMIGTWTTKIPEGTTGYYIAPASDQLFSTIYENFVDGEKLERFQVLFADEKSYVLTLPKVPVIEATTSVTTPPAKPDNMTQPVRPANFNINMTLLSAGAALIAVGLVVFVRRRAR